MLVSSLIGSVALTGNPSALVNLLPGGAGVQTAGSVATPWTANPFPDPLTQEFLDESVANQTGSAAVNGGVFTPVPIGTLVALVNNATNNPTGAQYQIATTALQPS